MMLDYPIWINSSYLLIVKYVSIKDGFHYSPLWADLYSDT